MNIGIVINSRLSSSRIPKKCMAMINGLSTIEHLLNRLQNTGLKIIVAVPNEDFLNYAHLNLKENVNVYRSLHTEDPLARMYDAAKEYKLDYIIRITHDKIFVDTSAILDLLNTYVIKTNEPKDYVYLKNTIPGTGFEIISFEALKKASKKFKNVEFIGYAIREVTKNYIQVSLDHETYFNIRLLIDYPNDLNLMHVIFSQLGNNCSLNQVVRFLRSDSNLVKINEIPKITVYTCALNAEKWIDRAIKSVMNQSHINFEYILIDDFSNDKTPLIMAKYASIYPNIKFIRNEKNLGLSSSCNIALKEAKGDYLIRLDADDYFINSEVLFKMYTCAESNKNEIIYPDYYKVNEDADSTLVDGDLEHHAGCALFSRSALNYVKFTDGLRGHDSLDVFIRAKSILKIGYLKEPMFCYIQRKDSLSKLDLVMRDKIKKSLLENKKVSSNL